MAENVYTYSCCDVFKPNTCKIFIEFEPNSEQRRSKSVIVRNISDEPQPLFVEGPLTNYFSADFFIPRGHVFPKTSVEIEVYCKKRLDTRPYYDRIAVRCIGGCGFCVKLVGSPKNKSVVDIPKEINFGTVPLGEIATGKILLPPIQKGMPFMVVCSVYSPELAINPMKGIVEDEAVAIEVSYRPMAYITVTYPLHIYLPTVTSLPFFLTVTADTKPGLIGEMAAYTNVESKKLPRIEYPSTKLPSAVPEVKPALDETFTWSQHQTNLFLLKKDEGPESDNSFLGPLGRPISAEEEIKKRKQEVFLNKVMEMRKSNSDALIHNKEVLTVTTTIDKNIWNQKWIIHEKDKAGFDVGIYQMSEPLYMKRRPIVSADDKDSELSFTNPLPSIWFVRYRILSKFINAARLVVIQNRLKKRFKVLKDVRKEDIERI